MRAKPNHLLLAAAIVVLSGCASGAKSSPKSSDRAPATATATAASLSIRASDSELLRGSTLEIVYLLGHDLRRITAESREGSVLIRELHDKETVHEAAIDRSPFLKLWKSAAQFVEEGQRSPATDTPCRKPFAVTLRVGSLQLVRNGCRLGSEGGALSHLAREAEFLMLSKGR